MGSDEREQMTSLQRLEPTREERQLAMMLHLSQLLGFVVPVVGLVAPVVLWQVKKAEVPSLEPHGKEVTNWIITSLIYTVIAIPLCFIVIGIPLLLVLVILSIVYPIVGGIRANEGIVWRYPFNLRFL